MNSKKNSDDFNKHHDKNLNSNIYNSGNVYENKLETSHYDFPKNLFTDSKIFDTSTNKKLNCTNYLLESSFGKSSMNQQNNISNIGKKFNISNTQYLINDKTSILLERDNEKIERDHSLVLDDLHKEKYKFNLGNLDRQIENSLLSITESEYTNTHRFVNQILENNNNNNNNFEKNQVEEDLTNFQNSKFDFVLNKKCMDFGNMFPGEISTQSFRIKNNSYKKNLQIELKIELDDKFLQMDEQNEYFSLKNSIGNECEFENSLKKYKPCFYFLSEDSENIIGIEYSSSINYCLKFFLEPDEEKEIFMNLKTPFIKKSEKLFGLLKIFSNKNLNSIPLTAFVVIPKLLCLKEIFSPIAKIPLITLSVQLKTKGQKFRIPFKNISIKDMEVEFSLDKNNNQSIFTLDGIEFFECQFIFFPKCLNILAGQSSTLELIAKVKKIRKDENFDEKKIGSQIRKVIIAKIKNADVFYSFFVEAWLGKKTEV